MANFKDPKTYTIVGKSMPRVDIPAKVTGGESFVQDLRLPGMLHARVVRPPRYGARLKDIDTSSVEKMPGVAKVVRDGSYLAVVASQEFQRSRQWMRSPRWPNGTWVRSAERDRRRLRFPQDDQVADRRHPR